VRPNLGDLNDFTPWRAGGLIDVLGSGVVRLAVAEARRRDAEYPEAAAYLDALEGEIDFREGRLDPAVRLAASALAGLPPEEALLRGRTLAWQADALRRLGNAEAARAAYQTVLRNYPSLLRILDVKVPARIVRDETPLARRVADRLAGIEPVRHLGVGPLHARRGRRPDLPARRRRRPARLRRPGEGGCQEGSRSARCSTPSIRRRSRRGCR
jgi:tetratricopeptide (TPR) repeat protein